MSQVNTYKHKVTNLDVFKQVCDRLGYELSLGAQTIKTYGTTLEVPAKLTIPGWKYPIGIDYEGQIFYDHWGSKEGTMEALGQAVQAYNEEVLKNEAAYDMALCNSYVEQLDGGVRKLILEYEY